MDNKETLNELIDKFASGSLTDAEREKLSSFVDEKPEIAQEMQIRKDISGTLKYVGNKELKSVLDKIHHEEFGQKTKAKTFNLKTILSIAAVFLGGLLVYQFAFNSLSGDINGEQMYTTNYSTYKASFQTRGDVESDFTKYKEAYIAGNYKEALALLTNTSEDLDSEILLTAGISAMETGDLSLARKYFEKVIAGNDFYFSDHAKWYAALSYLKEDYIEGAKPLLKGLAENTKADHHLEAKSLYNEIK